MDFAGKRYWFFLLSLGVIIPGIVFLIISSGLNPGIDFTGGSAILLKFADPVDEEDLSREMTALGHPDSQVNRLDDGSHFIRTKELREGEKDALVDELQSALSPNGIEVLSFDQVSASVGRATIIKALWAVLAAAVGIFFYVWWAFRNVPSPFRYGAAAIVALVHDAVVVIGIFAILGELADTEVNRMFLVALLTVIGYSVNDTIVVFDRLREKVIQFPNRTLAANVNLSISETISRSLNTSLTLLFTLLALMLFGGPTIQVFLLTLLVGVVAGTYSSIAIAAQTLVVWESGDIGRFYRRLRSPLRATTGP